MENTDASQAADLWLAANTEAHSFIPASYWREHYEAVKEMLLQAEVYVYEDENSNEIYGFIGLEDAYIAGVFVRRELRSKGTGRALLDYVKERKKELTLHVYAKNERAVRFYQREGFQILEKMTDEATGEEEYLMGWKRN